MLVGNFGSGKTEVAVNLALHLAAAGRSVQIADLDVVNPYFRCRAARERMERHGIRVVVPPGAQAFAELHIILPEIRGMLAPPAGTVTLFDVGGDDVGARALGSLAPHVGDYQLWQVLNARRPFTGDVEGCLAMQRAVAGAARLAVTGLVANTHLIDETDASIVLEGTALARAVAERSGVPLRLVTAMREIAAQLSAEELGAPLLPLGRHMLPPWLRDHDDDTLPAARPVPLGRRAEQGGH